MYGQFLGIPQRRTRVLIYSIHILERGVVSSRAKMSLLLYDTLYHEKGTLWWHRPRPCCITISDVSPKYRYFGANSGAHESDFCATSANCTFTEHEQC